MFPADKAHLVEIEVTNNSTEMAHDNLLKNNHTHVIEATLELLQKPLARRPAEMEAYLFWQIHYNYISTIKLHWEYTEASYILFHSINVLQCPALKDYSKMCCSPNLNYVYGQNWL